MRRGTALALTAAATLTACVQEVGSPAESTISPIETLAPYSTTEVSVTPDTTASSLPTTEPTIPTNTTYPDFPLPSDIFNPNCAVQVQPGDTPTEIANNAKISLDDLLTENNIATPDLIYAFDPLDICPDGIDDLKTGEPRVAPTTVPPVATTEPVPPPPTEAPQPTEPPTTPAPAELPTGVEAQQQHLNELFVPYGMPALDVDGIPGKFTDQMSCAARLALGLPASRADIVPGSEEEKLILSATSLPIPNSPSLGHTKWGLIDQTCQVAFFGEGDSTLSYVFPVSTGKPEFPTRNDTQIAHRYDPAIANNGWHNSSDYPADDDNPLNGNMFKPVYINKGQAIHGANNVPLEPASHGCTRMTLPNQDTLITWLDLEDETEEIWSKMAQKDFSVTTQGDYSQG